MNKLFYEEPRMELTEIIIEQGICISQNGGNLEDPEDGGSM